MEWLGKLQRHMSQSFISSVSMAYSDVAFVGAGSRSLVICLEATKKYEVCEPRRIYAGKRLMLKDGYHVAGVASLCRFLLDRRVPLR